jgi:hypothetical protein
VFCRLFVNWGKYEQFASRGAVFHGKFSSPAGRANRGKSNSSSKAAENAELRYARAYALARENAGAPDVDGESFGDVDSMGIEKWLAGLREELFSKTYRPSLSDDEAPYEGRRISNTNRRGLEPEHLPCDTGRHRTK